MVGHVSNYHRAMSHKMVLQGTVVTRKFLPFSSCVVAVEGCNSGSSVLAFVGLVGNGVDFLKITFYTCG